MYTKSCLLGYSQIINEPTNIEPNKSPSCIDLILTSQPNLVVESGVHPSLMSICHHQIIFAKISFKVFTSCVEREVWHYNQAQVSLIKRSIENLNWTRAFEGLSVNDQVELFNDSLLNILRNLIPHENIKCSSKDPPWMNKEIKGALRHKNRIYKKYISGGRKPEDEANLKETSSFVSDLIADTKSSYFQNLSKRLNDPLTRPKTYWSILKKLFNKAKIPSVPPLLVNDTFVTDFREKAGIFNVVFCKSMQYSRYYQGGFTSILPEVSYKTNKRFSSIEFSLSDIKNCKWT